MKKKVTPKNAKRLIKKTPDEKRGNPKKRKGFHQKKTSDKKRGNPKKMKKGS
jgi:hypothetical protein